MTENEIILILSSLPLFTGLLALTLATIRDDFPAMAASLFMMVFGFGTLTAAAAL